MVLEIAILECAKCTIRRIARSLRDGHFFREDQRLPMYIKVAKDESPRCEGYYSKLTTKCTPGCHHDHSTNRIVTVLYRFLQSIRFDGEVLEGKNWSSRQLLLTFMGLWRCMEARRHMYAVVCSLVHVCLSKGHHCHRRPARNGTSAPYRPIGAQPTRVALLPRQLG